MTKFATWQSQPSCRWFRHTPADAVGGLLLCLPMSGTRRRVGVSARTGRWRRLVEYIAGTCSASRPTQVSAASVTASAYVT